MLTELFGGKGLELNSVLRFDNSSVGRTALQAGAGLMLIWEEHALPGEQDGHLTISPIAKTEVMMSIAHQRGRQNDPLIEAFIGAAKGAWLGMKYETLAPRDARA